MISGNQIFLQEISKNEKQRKSKNHTKDIQLPNEKLKVTSRKFLSKVNTKKINDLDVTINHLENIFADETYYLAMKIVPLLERKSVISLFMLKI